ncbi:unnamed protein product [Medioppia subpectinata]|uniref:Uncharacterized protein n=1 Tax=Medioppia subpectinata TaxID=1979941 RepID=A0A7R9PZB8_9ACAR|nr:unnamed protein product [Medioppia subpectinata]CAG2106804.1 unnamed protein product [Medioppia subpectinata]
MLSKSFLLQALVVMTLMVSIHCLLCNNDGDCPTNECCVIGLLADQGVCNDLLPKGTSCKNTHCPCGPNLVCRITDVGPHGHYSKDCAVPENSTLLH